MLCLNKHTLAVYGIDSCCVHHSCWWQMKFSQGRTLPSWEECDQLCLLHVCLCLWAESCSFQDSYSQLLSKTVVLPPYHLCHCGSLAPESHMGLSEVCQAYIIISIPSAWSCIPLFSFERSSSPMNSLLCLSRHFRGSVYPAPGKLALSEGHLLCPFHGVPSCPLRLREVKQFPSSSSCLLSLNYNC